jgi:membrane-associated protease RseP (regulator of RpoE activity)
VTIGVLLALLGSVWSSQPAFSSRADVQLEASAQAIAHMDSLAPAERLSQVAYRLLVANADLCGSDNTLVLGMTTSMPSSHFEWEPVGGGQSHPTVLSVVPGAPAAESGLRVGDQIIEIEGELLPPGREGSHLLSHWLREHKKKLLNLGVERDGVQTHLTVRPLPACSYEVMLSPEGEANALAEGQLIIVTEGMLTLLVTDDELATVVAHEVAHIAAGHTTQGLDSGMQEDQEPEADYLGVYIAARAGYDVSGAADLLRQFAKEQNGEHQYAGRAEITRRLRAIETAINEVRTKRAVGKRLEPSSERQSHHDWLQGDLSD